MSSAHLDRVAAHRPYGLDCACGRPINSDEDWAQHLVEALGLTEETRTYEDFEVQSTQGGLGNPLVSGGQLMRSLGWVTKTRLVSPWRADGEG